VHVVRVDAELHQRLSGGGPGESGGVADARSLVGDGVLGELLKFGVEHRHQASAVVVVKLGLQLLGSLNFVFEAVERSVGSESHLFQ